MPYDIRKPSDLPTKNYMWFGSCLFDWGLLHQSALFVYADLWLRSGESNSDIPTPVSQFYKGIYSFQSYGKAWAPTPLARILKAASGQV